jgi:protein tyrosine phosphatase (PTP) superfamily phosphohydrolase (DUF442 family)
VCGDLGDLGDLPISQPRFSHLSTLTTILERLEHLALSEYWTRVQIMAVRLADESRMRHNAGMSQPAKPLMSFSRPLKWAVRGVVAVLLLGIGYEAVRVYGGTNRHEVIPGKVYRSSQPSGDDLREMVEKRGIKTVLNLRGVTPWDAWYQEESRANHDLNVSQEDVTMSAQALPAPAELRRVIDVFDHTEYPVLVHCKQGADRTGLVSAVALLLYTDATLSEAKRQLWPRYGHWPLARTVAMDRFFDLYDEWLTAKGESHTRERFRHWAVNEYIPGGARSKLTWVDPIPNPLSANTPTAFRVRCENRSNTAWQMKPGHFAGIHAAYVVFDENVKDVWSGRTGLRFETVPPGGTTEVIVPVKGLKPGRYTLAVDLHDATGAGIPFRTNSFVKFGDDSLVAELNVN